MFVWIVQQIQNKPHEEEVSVSTVLPEQSWVCSSHLGESGWRVWGPGSSRRWLSYTWHLQSRGRSPRWGPSPHSARSSHPGQVWRAQPGSRRVVPSVAAHAPVSSAPAPWSWASAGNNVPPHTAGGNPIQSEGHEMSTSNLHVCSSLGYMCD